MNKFALILIILCTIGIIYFIQVDINKTKVAGDTKNTSPLLLENISYGPKEPIYENINLENFYCPILLYHHIANSKSQNSYYVSPDIFEQQMEWLKENNYHIISFDRLISAIINHSGLPEKSVVITFDDGLKDQYENGYPILRKFGFSATFFIKNNNYNKGGMNTDMLKDMIKNGMIVGSHSMNHDNMASMDQKTLTYETEQSKKILEQDLGIKIKYFSYPGGQYSDNTINEIRNAGFIAAVSTRHKVNIEIKNENSIYVLPRVHIDDEMPTFIDWVQGKNLF